MGDRPASPSKTHARGRLLSILGVALLLNLLPASAAAAPQLITTITVGDTPVGVAVNPATNRIYVTNRQSNDITVIDASTNAPIATIPNDHVPQEVAIDPVTNRIYVSELGQGLSVLDGATNALVARIPVGVGAFGLAVSPATGRVYVSSFYDRYISVIDGASNSLITNISVGGNPSDVAVDTRTNQIYVANRGLGGVQVIDGSTNGITAFIQTGDLPSHLAMNTDTGRLYVTGVPSLGVIDTATRAVIGRVDVGGADDVAVNESLDRVYVSSLGTNLLWTVDGATARVMSSVPIGTFPAGIAVNERNNSVYVTKFFQRAIAVFIDPDMPPPGITASITPAPNAAGWNREDVTVSWTVADSRGVASTIGCETRTMTADTAGTAITCTATSVAGGTATQSVTVKLDKTPPSLQLTASKSDGSQYNAGEYTNQSVVVHAQCSDALSGLVEFCADVHYIFDTIDGATTWTVRDAAGNATTATFAPIRIDKTRPTVLGTATLTDGSTYIRGLWTNQTVRVSFSCTDFWSGIASCSAPQDLSASGTASVRGFATDRAGNNGTTDFGPILVDKIAPAIVASATLDDGRAYATGTWTNLNVTVHYTCTDDLSGVLSCTADQTFGGEGIVSATGAATDRARNSASTEFGPISIDRTGPTINFAGNAGSYLVDQRVVITCDAADVLSGVATTTCPALVDAQAFTFIDGSVSSTVTLSASATDNAGNTATAETSFSVLVTPDSLCRLAQTTAAELHAICAHVRSIADAPNQTAKQRTLDALHNYLQAHVGTDLSAELAALLDRLAQLI